MEDALRELKTFQTLVKKGLSLNPYCNGRCS